MIEKIVPDTSVLVEKILSKKIESKLLWAEAHSINV